MGNPKTEQKTYPSQPHPQFANQQQPPAYSSPTVPNPYASQEQKSTIEMGEIPSARAPMLQRAQPKDVNKEATTLCCKTPMFWYLFSLLFIVWDVVVLLFRVDKMIEQDGVIFPFMNVVYIICCILVIIGFLMKSNYCSGKAHYLLLPLIIMFVVQCLVYIVCLIAMILSITGAKNIAEAMFKFVGIFRCNFSYYNQSQDVSEDEGFLDSVGDFFKATWFIIFFISQAIWNGVLAFYLKKDRKIYFGL